MEDLKYSFQLWSDNGHISEALTSHRDIFNIFHEHNFPERPLLLVHLLFFFGGWSRAPSFYKVENIYPWATASVFI